MTRKFFEPESNCIPPPCTKYLNECINDNPGICRNYYTWDHAEHQEYVGNFAQENLHGYGEYVKVGESNSYMYEGTFYTNDFEGYSNVVYLNGDYFEGLFKHNERFGPGVYTYADSSQNVGLWCGTKLIRLSTIVMGEWVPQLAKSSIAKAKLLKYRKLVPLRQEYQDAAKNILTELNAQPKLVGVSQKLYNPYIRSMNSIFFDRKFYDVEFFGTLDCTIDVLDPTSCSLPVSPRHSMVSVACTKELASSKEIIRGILDYLIENAYVVENFADNKQFVNKSIIRPREECHSELDSNIVNEILIDFMKELDYILSKPNLEKALILKKKNIQSRIPQNYKQDIDINLKKATVTNLIAWNNEEIFVEILKHVFAHRNKEKNVSFPIVKLLSGDRSKFNTVGVLEKNCVLFLSHCSLGNENEVIKISNDSELNPDICDARGNSGIIFASARDMWRVITILCDLGANLDFVNDEGLTALSICLLRYIALQNDINDWERAFIPDATVTYEEELELKQWRPHISVTNLNTLNTISSVQFRAMPQEIDVNMENYNKVGTALKTMTDDNTGISNLAIYEELKRIEIGLVFKRFQDPYSQNPDFKQNYIFNAKCLSQPKKILKLKRRQQKEEKTSDKSNKKMDFTNLRSKTKKKEDEGTNFVKQNKLKVVFKTIRVLLSSGVDPNLSQVPLPALILAIFCNNVELFESLLKSTTNLDITSQDEGVSALHMLASLPFASQNLVMFRMLLSNGANPNTRTNTYHWLPEKERILGKHIFKGEDLGKTPMHILSIRYDFAGNEYIQTDMVKALIESGASLDNMYLGHTPLTLAILRGNLCLTKFYLESGQVNPYVKLGENMGVATTVLTLKRYTNFLSLEKCKAIYDLFTEKNVNPLVEIEGCGNAIEFIELEYCTEKEETDSNKDSARVSGKTINNKSTQASFQRPKGTRSRDRKEKHSYNEETRKYLIECAKHMLEKHIQQQAFKYLKRFIMQNVDFEDSVLIALVKFLPFKDMARLIQLFIHRGLVHATPYYFYIILVMLELSKKYDKTREKKSKNNDLISLPPAVILKKLDWTESDVVSHYNMVDPELDTETNKYLVCFYCCKKAGKDLIVCPACGLVYFCSEDCNKLSNKECTVHKCGTLFYEVQRRLRNDALQNNGEYVTSKLDDKLGLLDATLRKKYPHLGVSEDTRSNDFDKLSSVLFDKVLENSTNFLERVRAVLTGNDLLNLEEIIKQEELVTKRHESLSIYQSNFDPSISKESYQKKFERGKSKDKAANSKEMNTITTNISTENVEAKEQIIYKHKRGSRNDCRKSSHKSANGKQQGDTRNSEHKHKTTKPTCKRFITKSKGNIIHLKDKARRYPNENKSCKHAVYKHDISVSCHTKSMKDKYNLEQIKFLKNYEDRTTLRKTLLNEKFTLASLFDKVNKDILSNFSRLPHKCQFLIERLSELFPGIDISHLFWPYACYVNGQLYYRFLEGRPVFLETYSNL